MILASSKVKCTNSSSRVLISYDVMPNHFEYNKTTPAANIVVAITAIKKFIMLQLIGIVFVGGIIQNSY